MREIVDQVYEWYKAWSPEDQATFRTTPAIQFHFGLGMGIRNEFRLWEKPWTEEIDERGVDVSPEHPDNLSQRIIKLVQERAINDYTSNN